MVKLPIIDEELANSAKIIGIFFMALFYCVSFSGDMRLLAE
jgi:hypothetical protein